MRSESTATIISDTELFGATASRDRLLVDEVARPLIHEQENLVGRTTVFRADDYANESAKTDHASIPRAPVRIKRPAPRRIPMTRARFILHEMWEGVVEEIYDTYFVGQLVSKTISNTYEVAEIYRSEISPADASLLRRGAVFYWTIGYEERPSGQRYRSSMIRFRRLPPTSPIKTDTWIASAEETWLTSS
jgi:hypothetical protein